jgi:cytochrome c556
MSNRARTAAFGVALAVALGVWLGTAADLKSADEKGSKVGPYNGDILNLVEGKGTAAAIAGKADLGDLMQAFKPRSKGGLGIGPTADAIKPDGIEQKFIDLGKSKRGLSKADLAKQADALAKAADATRAISDVTLLYADKEGKKNPSKWKQYVGEMNKAAEDLSKAARKSDSDGIKKAVNKLNDSCINCHSDFRD